MAICLRASTPRHNDIGCGPNIYVPDDAAARLLRLVMCASTNTHTRQVRVDARITCHRDGVRSVPAAEREYGVTRACWRSFAKREG